MSKQRKEDISVLSPLKLQGIRKTDKEREKKARKGDVLFVPDLAETTQ